jgi:UDP-N-acetylmuramate--alanine ligase
MSDWSGRRLHFIGIGGAGMSGLALVCARLGATVSGSDRADSSYMERLRRAGLEPAIGHDAANLPEGAEVVVSTAIDGENPELVLARERGTEPIHRGALLAELCAEKRLIAIAGTHGKTTTTAMVAWVLRKLGADPAFFVGGEVPALGPDGEAVNASWGEGEWVVAEADESDASFLRLRPEIAVVTNVEMDHHARWGSLSELHQAFESFLAPAKGRVLPAQGVEWMRSEDAVKADDDAAAKAEDDAAKAEDDAVAKARDAAGVRFDLAAPGPADLRLSVPGEHNLRNARAALGALALAGFDLDAAAAAFASFPGVRRRLELKGSRGALHIYDDYAHHPTEVKAALSALRELEPSRLLAVFQPHLYSRTKALAEEFGAALTLADEVIVLDVYPAREKPAGELAGVSGLQVVQAVAERNGGKPVWWLPDATTAERALTDRLNDHPELWGERPLLVTVGAGDVFRLAEALVSEGPS